MSNWREEWDAEDCRQEIIESLDLPVGFVIGDKRVCKPIENGSTECYDEICR